MKKLINTLILALVLTPLIVDHSVFFPDQAGKIFFTRLILVITSVLFISYFVYNKNFKEETLHKVRIFLKNPLTLSIFFFIFSFFISTILAVDTYTAFWGDIQRGEGFVGIMYFFILFVYTFLIFDKKDWTYFFKLSLLVTSILLIKEFWMFLNGGERPGSFIGNPTFLAGYLIFSLSSTIIVFRETSKKFWKYFSIGIFIASIIGIFITETRGAILGLLLGCVAVLFYGAFRGRGVFYKKLNFQKTSVFLLCALVIFSASFLVTRKSDFWQQVPGLARVATISREDISTRTRLFSIELSLQAVDPASNGWQKLLIGWGPNNFIQAFGKYYNPSQYKYEIEWFDRAHSKPLDILVMTGILGILAYLSIWFFYFKHVLRRYEFSLETISLVFFGVAFFVHLLFVFDNISTSLPFFALLAFIVSRSSYYGSISSTPTTLKNQKEFLVGIIFFVLTIFFGFILIRGDVPAYFQMKKYIALKHKSSDEIIIPRDSMFQPMTIAQTIIRRDFLTEYLRVYSAKSLEMNDVLDESFARADEYVEKMPYDFRFFASVASIYNLKGKQMNNSTYITKGEEYFRKALVRAPLRPEFNYGLALNLAYQDKYDEAVQTIEKIIEADKDIADSYYYLGLIAMLQGEKFYEDSLNQFEKSFNIKPYLFTQNKEDSENIYNNMVKYFYNKKDKANFTRVVKRLVDNGSVQSPILEQMLFYVEGKGVWPVVEFK